MSRVLDEGSSTPLGATPSPDGVNFSVFSKHATGVELLLFDAVDERKAGYCQDNETSWFDWTLLAKRPDLHRFVSLLNARRVLRDVEHERQRLALNQLIRQADITWHGVELQRPDWTPSSHSIAFMAKVDGVSFHVILNAYWEPLEFELPSASDGGRHQWRRWIDTFLDSPDDIVDWERAPLVSGHTYRAGPRSVVVLFSGLDPTASMREK